MKHAPILFLLGPPSAGKTTLGRRACNELGLAFRDLAEADLKRLLRAPRAPANHRHLARMLTGVCTDLNAAGQLVVMYGMLEANRIMEQFAAPPYRFEFERKLTDRPALVARYCRNLDGFARFLRERGELTDGDR